jgi:hypothetical protein
VWRRRIRWPRAVERDICQRFVPKFQAQALSCRDIYRYSTCRYCTVWPCDIEIRYYMVCVFSKGIPFAAHSPAMHGRPWPAIQPISDAFLSTGWLCLLWHDILYLIARSISTNSDARSGQSTFPVVVDIRFLSGPISCRCTSLIFRSFTAFPRPFVQ